MLDAGETEFGRRRQLAADYLYRGKKKRLLEWLFLYVGFLGIALCFTPEDDLLIDLILGLPVTILGVAWCFTDAAERSFRLGPVMKLFLIFFFIFGIFVYLIRTRGMREWRSLVTAIACIVALFACLFGTAYLTASLFFDADGNQGAIWFS